MKDLKVWTKIFKGFGNISRLRIIRLLHEEGELSVGEIAARIHVSAKGTSKHVLLLHGLGILDRNGRNGQVFYSLEDNFDVDVRSLVAKILR